jgi:AraC-like DNA-binding protein
MPKDGLLVYDLTREMKARSSAFDNLSLIIPRAQLAPLLNGPDGQHMRALRGDAPLVDLLRSHIQHLEASAGRLGPTQARHLAQASLHLVAACLNSAADPAEASVPSDVPSQLLAACRYIEARLWDRNLDTGALCRLLGVSRTRLYEIFAPLGGVAGHIRERRLRAALSMLVDPALREVPIAAIAERCLFTPAEISRAFRRHFGLSPRAARHHAMAPRFVLDAQGLDRSYEHWLQHLVASPRYPEHAAN